MVDQATYRREVVGSLLRPAYLADARRQFESDQFSVVEFKAIEDRAVDEAIALQEAISGDVVTDGEMRCYTFYEQFVDAFEGFDKSEGIVIPLERLALSPQCCFVSTMAGNRLTVEEERRKLELVTRVAGEVWSV